MKNELKIGPLTAAEGEKVSGYLPIINSEVEIPITLINGKNEGETILICGGVHNAEYVGIQSAIELAEELEPEDVTGNIIVIHLLNRTGFEHRTMSLVYEDGKNINRVFPGDAYGTLADQIAYTLEHEVFAYTDYYIDLHCGDGYEGLEPYVYCLGNANGHVVEMSRKMAEIVQVDYLVVSKLNTEGAYNYAGSLGIPSILIERGCKATWDQTLVEEDKQDVKNIMRYLGILEGEVQRNGSTPIAVDPVIYEDAPVTGCWYPSFQPGETFKKGEVLGVIKDYFGNVLFTCYAKQDGIVLYETISLCIIKDGPMITYGAWSEK